MTIRQVCAVYFSATGKTKELCEALAAWLAEGLSVTRRTIDFTLPAARMTATPETGAKRYVFEPDELVIFGMPTYAGKLPNKLLPFVKEGFQGAVRSDPCSTTGEIASNSESSEIVSDVCASGYRTPAVALVSFGNRSFDNALAELCACLTADGFTVAAAGAFAAEHAFLRTLAAGRPDAADYAVLHEFADAILNKLQSAADPAVVTDASKGSPTTAACGEWALPPAAVPGDTAAPYYTPLGLDGEPKKFLKAVPKTDPALCDRCGKCAALCPMGSIDLEDPALVTGICIKCHACIKGCPKDAKYFDDEAFLSHRAMLEQTYGARRAEPQWFV